MAWNNTLTDFLTLCNFLIFNTFRLTLIIDLFIVIENYVIKTFGVLLEKVIIEISKIIFITVLL